MMRNFSLYQAFAELFKSIPYGIIVLKENRIVGFNHKAKEILGINEIGKEWLEFVPHEYRAEMLRLLRDAKTKKLTIKFDSVLLKQDGNKFYASLYLMYIKDHIFIIFEGDEKRKLQNIMHDLKEKVKELSCLYAIETISRKDKHLDGILMEIADIVPNILQHSELACCRIILKGKEYRSKNYKNMTASISADIHIHGKKEGVIEVGYVKPIPCNTFFGEEKKALQHIAMRIANIVEYMEAKNELRKSKEYFQALVEESSDVIMVIDEKMIVEYISPSIKKILGFSLEEIVGKSALEFIHPKEEEIAFNKFEEIISNPEKVVSAKFRVRCKDGNWKIVEGRGRNLLANPVVEGIVIIFNDITELVEKKRALRESESKLKALFNATHDLLLLIASNGTILDFNEAMAKSLGKKREEAIGKNVWDYKEFIDGKAFNRRWRYVMEVIKAKKPVHFVDSRDGRWFDNTYYPIFDENGNVIQVAIFARDITDLKKAKERLEQVVENANEWIWEVDENGLYTYSSPAVEKILGYKPEEIIGKKHFYDLFHPEDREKLKEEAFEIFRKKQPFRNFLNRNLHKNGEERWLITSGVPVLDEKGNLKGYRGLDLDITEKKRAQEKIKELNKYLESIIENANVWIDVLDEKGNVVIWNKAAEEISGYKREEVIGHKKIWEWLYPNKAYREKIFRKAMDIIKGEVVKDFETVIHTKNGEKKIISWYSRNLLDENGKIIGSVALGIDVTEQRKAEKMAQTLINATHDLMLLAKTDGTILDLNEAMAKALGKKREEIIGTNIKDYLPLEVYKRRTAKVREVERTKKKVRFIDSRNGRWFDHCFYPIFDENGNVTHIAVFSRDITEQRKMEREVRKFKTIADTANYGVAILDVNGKIAYVNDYFAKVHGYNANELVGEYIDEISSKDKNSLLHLKEKILEKGYANATEIYQQKRGGKIFPMLAAGTLVKDEENPPYIAITAIDITERKEMEEQLLQQKKLASLGRLAAVVAHELNTPLANIMITAEYLMEKAKDYKEELETIKKEVENASSIVRDVLNFSRIGIKEKKEVDMKEIVDNAIEKVKRILPCDDVIIQNRVENCKVIGDSQRLMECFVNIIKNAVMAKDENKGCHYVIIDAVEKDDRVEIIVRDNGIGMDDEVQREALKPFFTTRPLGEGTGLGLFIANWIAEEHGGKIEIKSKKGEGTEVKVFLKIK